MTTDPAPHAFKSDPEFTNLCTTCGWWGTHPMHSTAGKPILAEVPDHGESSFDYSQLEQRMWERVEEKIDAAFGRGSGMYAETVTAIRAHAFAYRLEKTQALPPVEVPVELLPELPGYIWVRGTSYRLERKP